MADVNRDLVAEIRVSKEDPKNPPMFVQNNGNPTPNRNVSSQFGVENSVPDLSLGLSVGGSEQNPLVRSFSANRGTFNENDLGFVFRERSSSLPPERGVEQWMVNGPPGRVAGDAAGKMKGVMPAESQQPSAAMTATRNSAFCRAMGKIQTAKRFDPRNQMMMQGHGHPYSNFGHPNSSFMRRFNSRAVARRRARPLPAPTGCRVMRDGGLYDMPSGVDPAHPDPAKRGPSYPGESVVNGVTGMELLDKVMPSVSVVGDGPFGRRIEGFLCSSYMQGELSIVCVCHGNFHTPAEFMKHAGGTGLGNPMKDITVAYPY